MFKGDKMDTPYVSETLKEFRIAVQDAASAVLAGNWTLETFYSMKLSCAVQAEFSFTTFARLVGKKIYEYEGLA
jgi:hypothetical protein